MPTIGIDLGTTNTVAAVSKEVLSVKLEHGGAILPSVVAFPPSQVTLVGTNARRRRAIDAKNTIFSAKRIIGRTWHSEETGEFRNRYPFEMVQAEGNVPAFKVRTGTFTPTQIGTFVVSALFENVPIDTDGLDAIVAVPSGFSDDHRNATAEAVRAAGAANVRVIDEPVCTAIAYTETTDTPAVTAVYDLGGGTFDFAVLDCANKPFEVLAHGGDLYLGGDDIDQAVASWAAERVLEEHRWDLRDNAVIFDRLVSECERAKVRLCYASETKIELAQVDPAAPAATSFLTVGQDVLADLTLDLVRRSFVICDEVLARAGVKVANIGAVYLAGGTTQLPMVRNAVGQYFGTNPISAYDPMEVVAIGASLGGTRD